MTETCRFQMEYPVAQSLTSNKLQVYYKNLLEDTAHQS